MQSSKRRDRLCRRPLAAHRCARDDHYQIQLEPACTSFRSTVDLASGSSVAKAFTAVLSGSTNVSSPMASPRTFLAHKSVWCGV